MHKNNMLKGGNMYTFVSHNEQETKAFAKNMASKLNKGDIIVLSGDLGSRKN